MDVVGSISWIYRRSIPDPEPAGASLCRWTLRQSGSQSSLGFLELGGLLVTPGIIPAVSIGKVYYRATIPWIQTQELLFPSGYFRPTWAADGWKCAESFFLNGHETVTDPH